MLLVVDDEKIIQKVLGMMLKRLGHEVLIAGSGEEGIRLYREHKDEVKLAIIDVSMPDMDGYECLQNLAEINPEIRAAMSSGFETGGDTAHPNVVGHLPKPFGIEDLTSLLDRIL